MYENMNEHDHDPDCYCNVHEHNLDIMHITVQFKSYKVTKCTIWNILFLGHYPYISNIRDTPNIEFLTAYLTETISN